MARSPFTLAAAVTAALPGAEVTGARALSAGADGRFDSAVATLADGREVAIRVADDDDTARELAAEALALRALTAGVRAMLPFRAPEYLGETQLGEGRALVTELLPGFQIEAPQIPAGRGAAESMGAAIAALHSLPSSVIRSAGLPARSADESREELRQLVDAASATGRVPARLTVRWREAVSDDELWRFESTVILGGVQATSFLFADDPERGPEVTGLVGWHSLSVGDPAVDLSWLSAAPDAASDVHAAYARGADRVPDAALETRARLLAELEFARWLTHGDSLHRPDIVDDAAALLEALAEGLRGEELVARPAAGVDSALDALDRVPARPVADVDTSMQTDAYNPDQLWHAEETGVVPSFGSAGTRRAEMLHVETEDLSEVLDSGLLARERSAASSSPDPAIRTPEPAEETGPGGAGDRTDADAETDEDAQRAARAALQRWRSSASE